MIYRYYIGTLVMMQLFYFPCELVNEINDNLLSPYEYFAVG